jgi:hypothetical protein
VNRLLEAADRQEGRIKGAITRSGFEGQKRVSLRRAFVAFRKRDRAAVEREALQGVQAMQKALDTAIPPVIMAVVSAGADVAASQLGRASRKLKASRLDTPKIKFRFDRTNPSAVAWVERHAAELVTEVSDETRKAIRQIINRAFVEGIPPRQAAELLRKVVGLHSRDVAAIVNLRKRILDSPGGKVYAGKTPIRVPEKGMTKAKLRQTLSKYADRLRNKRALMIARTETIKGSNEGQNQLWKQAIEAGELPRTVMRVWITTPDERLCPICEALDGVTAKVFGSFNGQFDGPPAHPNCRCTTGIQ